MRAYTFLLVAFALPTAIFSTSALAQAKKDTITMQTPDRSTIEVKVPHDLQVKQIGPNHFEIHRNDPALKQIEIKVTPPKKQ